MTNNTLSLNSSVVVAGPGVHMPAAVFWDMDGTLINSEVYWAAGEQYVIEKHGGTFSTDVPLRARGQSTPKLLEILQEYIPEHIDSEVLRSEIIGYVIDREREKPCWATGAVELLGKLAEAGVPNVIVSASPRAMVSNMVEQAPEGSFVGYVCGEDGLAPKPSPAPYLRAAEIVGADPADCLVFEDSPVGLESGGAAGCTVVAITGFTPEQVVFDGPQVTNIKDYVGLELDDVANFMELGSVMNSDLSE
ncbi:MAG: HAD family hydrolase [Bifidobacteriaceae bacterium]|nr:HAD family hydrolase [Bifidobacteriaceae bacterium]